MSNNAQIEPQVLQVTAYNELITAQLTPVVQVSAQYNQPVGVGSFIIGGGTTTVSGGEYVVSTDTGADDFAVTNSIDQVISRAAQGSCSRFTARFSTPQPNSRMTAGVVSTGDSIEFGYLGADFGVFYDHDGLNGIQELEVTTPASGSENASITLDGTLFTVPLTSGTVEENATEIVASLTSQTPFFIFSQNEGTVVIKGLFSSAQVGVFSFSSSTAIASYTQIELGAPVVSEFTSQANWSEDIKADLDPSKINYYTVRWNGDAEYFIQDSESKADILVHKTNLLNTKTTPIFSINSFRLGWNALNTGNTTPITVSGSQGAAFNEGVRFLSVPTNSTINSDVIGVGTTLTNILTLRGRDVFGNKNNLGVILAFSVSASCTGNNKNAIIELIKNADLTTGALQPNYKYHNKDDSIAEVSTVASTVTGGQQLLVELLSPETQKRLTAGDAVDGLAQGETLTIAMRVTSGSAGDMSATMGWKEDK